MNRQTMNRMTRRPRETGEAYTLAKMAVVLLAALVLPTATLATTYVMTTDRELVDRSDLVVLGKVLEVSASPDEGRIQTDYLVEIDRVVNGFVPASTIVVRALGGTNAEGVSMRVFGQPTLTSGNSVVLFLNHRSDGAYEFSELGLSVFFTTEVEGRRYAFRDLGAGTQVLDAPRDQRPAERALAALPRRLDDFLDWVATYAEAGEAAPAPDFYVERTLPSLQAATANFTTLVSGGGCGNTAGSMLRWFEFDEATNVRFQVDQAGVPGVPGNGLNDVDDAFDAWNRVNGTSISLRYAGTTGNLAPSISLPLDERNLAIFEDLFNEISGVFTGSGTLAIGTVFFRCPVRAFAQGLAHEIIEAGIVFQDGAAANFFGISLAPLQAFLEVFTHEVGHTLGIGHSCGDGASGPCSGAQGDAIMRAFAYDDGRGARLNSDDRAAATFLYALVNQGAGPEAPASLLATPDSSSQITLTWADQSSDETSFEVEERALGGEFSLISVLDPNTTSLIVENIPMASYREYRVRARNAQGVSEYSEIASATTNGTIGTCVEDAATICLNDGRFQVTSQYSTPSGDSGDGQQQEITDDTGYFWFFEDTNVEVVLKVLNACGINQNYWVFAGGLTNVEVTLLVVDKDTGRAQTYFNPQDTAFQPIQDIEAFATCP